jgi:hypothetical protein
VTDRKHDRLTELAAQFGDTVFAREAAKACSVLEDFL